MTSQAVATTLSGRPGPVHINIGIDILRASIPPVEELSPMSTSISGIESIHVDSDGGSVPLDDAAWKLQEASQRLWEAERQSWKHSAKGLLEREL